MKRFISLLVIVTVLLSINFTVNAQGKSGKYVVKSDRAAQIYTSPVDDMSKLTPLGVADIASNTQVEIVDTKFNMGHILAPADGWLLMDDLDPVPAQPADFQPTAVTGWQKIDPATLPPATAGLSFYPGIGALVNDYTKKGDIVLNLTEDQMVLAFGGSATVKDGQQQFDVGTGNKCYLLEIVGPTSLTITILDKNSRVQVFAKDPVKFDEAAVMYAIAQKYVDLQATYKDTCAKSVDVRLNVSTQFFSVQALPVGWEKVDKSMLPAAPADLTTVQGLGSRLQVPLALTDKLVVTDQQVAVVYGEAAKIGGIQMGGSQLCYLFVAKGPVDVPAVADGSMYEIYGAAPNIDIKALTSWFYNYLATNYPDSCGIETDMYIKN